MEIATLIIAALGVLLGALSLGWQAATYVLTGGRVKIALKVGAVVDSGTGMALMPVAEATPDKLASLGQQGFSRAVIAVEVRNVGRLPVTVSRWSLESSLGVSYVPIADSLGSALPHRLDLGEPATWALDLHQAIHLVKTTTEVLGKGCEQARVHGVVELGDGRRYTTTDSLG